MDAFLILCYIIFGSDKLFSFSFYVWIPFFGFVEAFYGARGLALSSLQPNLLDFSSRTWQEGSDIGMISVKDRTRGRRDGLALVFFLSIWIPYHLATDYPCMSNTQYYFRFVPPTVRHILRSYASVLM